MDWGELMRTGEATLAARIVAATRREQALDQSLGGLILLAVFTATRIFAVLALKRDQAHD